jgi:dTDP-4-amino-4,6-dideoxygalactose transaminase
VIQKAHFIKGPDVLEFEKELAQYLDVKHVIACANGTDALQIALMALGLQPGDEVITPSFTYIATVEVVALLHLKPVFVEVNKDTFTIDVAQIEAAITPKTKAIVPVHLYGQSVDMEPLEALAKKYNLPIIEDNAQAIGSTYTYSNGATKKTGSMGTIACTSFFPSKNLGCYGDGGAIMTNDDALADSIKMIANHGQSKRYYHDVVGCNSRLDTIQAAVLRIKLRLLDQYCDARRKVADYYDNAFANHPKITIPARNKNSKHVFHQYTLLIENSNRDELIQHLADAGIPSMIYYPVPAHKQKMFATLQLDTNELNTTDWLTERVISLPIHTEMDEEQLAYITSHFLKFV